MFWKLTVVSGRQRERLAMAYESKEEVMERHKQQNCKRKNSPDGKVQKKGEMGQGRDKVGS